MQRMRVVGNQNFRCCPRVLWSRDVSVGSNVWVVCWVVIIQSVGWVYDVTLLHASDCALSFCHDKGWLSYSRCAPQDMDSRGIGEEYPDKEYWLSIFMIQGKCSMNTIGFIYCYYNIIMIIIIITVIICYHHDSLDRMSRRTCGFRCFQKW